MARKKNKRYSKKSAIDKVIQKSIKGFWLRFSLEDPLGEHDMTTKVQVGSTNPVVQLRLMNDHFWDCLRQVLHHKPVKWRIEVRMEFTRKDGGIEYKAQEMVAYGRLPELDEHYQGMVEDLFADAEAKSYLDRYVKTYVSQEVLSGQVIQDEDFTE